MLKIKVIKKSRFLLGLVCLAVGISFTVCFYEGKQLYKDYSTAMGYYSDYLDKKDVGEVVSATSQDAPRVEDEVQLHSPDVESRIREIAKRENFKNADLLVRIARCESGLIPNRRSDVAGSSAMGLFQILDMHGLTVDERCNIDTSTLWTINKIKSGGLNAWNASKKCWSI